MAIVTSGIPRVNKTVYSQITFLEVIVSGMKKIETQIPIENKTSETLNVDDSKHHVTTTSKRHLF